MPPPADKGRASRPGLTSRVLDQPPSKEPRGKLVELLQSWIDGGDAEEQKETGEYLIQVLDEDRLSDPGASTVVASLRARYRQSAATLLRRGLSRTRPWFDVLLQKIERHGAVPQDLVVEGAEVEGWSREPGS